MACRTFLGFAPLVCFRIFRYHRLRVIHRMCVSARLVSAGDDAAAGVGEAVAAHRRSEVRAVLPPGDAGGAQRAAARRPAPDVDRPAKRCVPRDM